MFCDAIGAGSARVQLPLTFKDMGPPKAVSRELGLDGVRIDQLNMVARPPSGATFTFRDKINPFRVMFTPDFAPAGPD